jgi:hypothetical protein
MAVTIPTTPGLKFTNLGSIFSELLKYVLVAAGLYLFAQLVLGGIDLMFAAGEPGKIKSAGDRITNAFIGFIIIFVSYFIVQIVQLVLGIKIL